MNRHASAETAGCGSIRVREWTGAAVESQHPLPPAGPGSCPARLPAGPGCGLWGGDAEPSVGRTRPASARSSVVFPAPFGPTSKWTRPAGSSRLADLIEGGDRPVALGQPGHLYSRFHVSVLLVARWIRAARWITASCAGLNRAPSSAVGQTASARSSEQVPGEGRRPALRQAAPPRWPTVPACRAAPPVAPEAPATAGPPPARRAAPAAAPPAACPPGRCLTRAPDLRPASPSNRARLSAPARPGRSSAATCATRTTT